MAAPTNIQLADGTVVDSHDAVCGGCGEPLDGHSCGASASSAVIVSRSGKGSTRKPISAKPRCAHCNGVMHYNLGATEINAACLNRQYALDKGEITDPDQKVPVLTIERMGDISEWGKALSTPPTYGKMVSAAGGVGTYSGLRVPTGRKKKAVAAAAGEKIEDIAASVEAPAPKARKGRKDATTAASLDDGTASTTTENGEKEAAVAEAEKIAGGPAPKGRRASKASTSPNGNSAGEELATATVESVKGAATDEAPAEDEKERRRAERAARRAAAWGKSR